VAQDDHTVREVQGFEQPAESSFQTAGSGLGLTALAYSGNCEYLALGYTDSIEIYDRRRKRISRQRLREPPATREALAFWPKDPHVIVIANDFALQFWNWECYRYFQPAE
jgi:hypothetical protein